MIKFTTAYISWTKRSCTHGWPGVSEFPDVSHYFGEMKQTVINAKICWNLLEYGKVCKTHLTCASISGGMAFTDQCFKWEPQRSLNFKEIMCLGIQLSDQALAQGPGFNPLHINTQTKIPTLLEESLWNSQPLTDPAEEKRSPLSRASFWQRACTAIQEIRQRIQGWPFNEHDSSSSNSVMGCKAKYELESGKVAKLESPKSWKGWGSTQKPVVCNWLFPGAIICRLLARRTVLWTQKGKPKKLSRLQLQ